MRIVPENCHGSVGAKTHRCSKQPIRNPINPCFEVHSLELSNRPQCSERFFKVLLGVDWRVYTLNFPLGVLPRGKLQVSRGPFRRNKHCDTRRDSHRIPAGRTFSPMADPVRCRGERALVTNAGSTTCTGGCEKRSIGDLLGLRKTMLDVYTEKKTMRTPYTRLVM